MSGSILFYSTSGLATAEKAIENLETAAEPEGHHGPTLLGLDAAGWVYVGVTIFFVLAFVVFKAHRKITDALDERIADTRRSLDEAAAVKKEAEALLAQAKATNDASKKDAKAIIKQAGDEAKALVAQAEVDADDMVARRKKAAEERIAASERSAIAEVRAKAATASVGAAERLIAEQHNAASDKALVDEAIASLN